MRLIHLTDPHLSNLDDEKFLSLRGKRWSGYLSWRMNRSHRYLPVVLSHLVDAIKSEGADQILLTGDLIQIGLDSEITQAADWLANLGSAEQVMLVPGNHDVYARGSSGSIHTAWSEYLFRYDPPEAVAKSGEYPVLRKLGNISVIGVSTACVTPVFMANGSLGEEQLLRLAVLLEQADEEGQLVCLLIHHPPLPGMAKRRKALTDADGLQSLLKRHSPMLILHGHLHHNREFLWGESRIFCTSAASSASDASYRVIDIEAMEDSWVFRMTLKSIIIDHAGEVKFAITDEQRWQLPKSRG
jgi:3',5'-cyclic AMP phosphodiesterase CpdA